MKTAKKVLALLLSVLMVFTMVSSSVVAIAETEPAEKTQIEDVENSMSNTFDSIKGIIEGVHNLVGGIMSVLGKECVFCDEIHGKTEDTEEPTEPEEPESPADNCSCSCHKKGLMGIIWKILNFFYKIFGMNKACDCGISHY